MFNLAITRCCVLTPLGDSNQTWDALCAGRRVGDGGKPAAVADELLPAEGEWDRSIRLGLAAAQNALKDIADPGDTCLFCGTSKGPVGAMLSACDKLRRGQKLAELEARQVALGVGAMGVILREKLALKPPAHTSVAACSSGIFALHRAATAIARGECRRALVVAADASLHPLFQGAFDRMGVLAKPADGKRMCEPYGPDQTGFFVSEAAAAVLLQRATPETSSLGSPIVQLQQTWIGADGTGIVAVDEKTTSLRQGLRNCAPGQNITFVHGHGTGTGHDKLERDTVRDILQLDPAMLFSHKKWLGHSLGAAGLVGVVISAMCHQRQRLPNGQPVPPGSRSLTIAQGFGGHIGIVALRGF